MLDKSEIRSITLQHILPMKNFLGLHDWCINYSFGRIQGGYWMTCDTSNFVYKIAKICVCMHGAENDSEIIDNLFHEQCHILHASFRGYQAAMQSLIPGIDQVIRVDHQAWSQSAEEFVLRMEYLWRNYLRNIYLERFTDPENI